MTNKDLRRGTALLIGESLIDIVVDAKSPDGSGTAANSTEANSTEASGTEASGTEEYVGGSPANAAIGVARLRHPARLLTRLGRDARGERIAELLRGEGVELLPQSWGDGRTSTAEAIIAEDGSASYRFDLSWQLGGGDPEPADLVHAGSIGLFLEPGGTEVLRLLRRYHGTSLVTLDPNIRPALLPDHGAAVRRFEDAAGLADLVKLSDEDAEWLYPGLAVEEVAAHLRGIGVRIVVVTLGADGAFGDAASGSVTVPAVRVEVVDTISAGDSFMASLICSLLELDGSELDGTELDDAGLNGPGIDRAALTAVLERAAQASGIAVSAAGANPPTLAALDAAAETDGLTR